MQLADPTPTRFDFHFRVFGIPVRVHPLFWLVTGLFGLMQANHYPMDKAPIVLGLWLAAVLVSLLAHELGHALVAKRYGWPPKITIYSMGGLASYQPGRQSRASRILIALAGPGAGFVFGALIIGICLATGHQTMLPGLPIAIGNGPPVGGNLGLFVQSLLLVNIFWGLINLAPVQPLDGGTVALAILQKYRPGNALELSYKLGIGVCVALVLVAIVIYHSMFLAIMFGFLGYNSFQGLQYYRS